LLEIKKGTHPARLHEEGEYLMADEKQKVEPKPGRMEALRNLPGETMRLLTKEEVRAFLFEEEWPDSLREKLKDYIVE
jgi:hypothetical protein